MGHFAVVLEKHGRTEIKLDRFGGYHLFYSADARIVSSSFYAICCVLPSLTLTQQSTCEYVFNGVVSGNETLFHEVKLAPIEARIVVGPHGLEVFRPRLLPTPGFNSGRRDALLRESIALLDSYFGAVGRSFSDRVRCALSGGYDSRLILAYLRRHGIRASVYVYGGAEQRDVRFATHIARGEGFDLESSLVDPTTPANVDREDGRGLFLMRKLMDSVERVELPHGSKVRMTLHRE